MKVVYGVLLAIIIAIIWANQLGYELLTQEEINQRVDRILSQKIDALRDEMRQQILMEQASLVPSSEAPIVAQETIVPDSNLRKTLWGMTQKEVMIAEGTNYLKNTGAYLLYKVITAALPTIIKYEFEEQKLVRATIYFADPRLASYIRPKGLLQAEADYYRVHELLCNKYGPANINTNLISKLEDLVRTQERLNDQLQTYKRQYDDLSKDRDRKYKDLLREYGSWNNGRQIIDKYLAEYDKNIERTEDYITDIEKRQEDIDSQIREEEYRRKDGRLPKSVTSKWYYSGAYDITLTLNSTPEAVYLWLAYNGFVSERVSEVPSDL